MSETTRSRWGYPILTLFDASLRCSPLASTHRWTITNLISNKYRLTSVFGYEPWSYSSALGILMDSSWSLQYLLICVAERKNVLQYIQEEWKVRQIVGKGAKVKKVLKFVESFLVFSLFSGNVIAWINKFLLKSTMEDEGFEMFLCEF